MSRYDSVIYPRKLHLADWSVKPELGASLSSEIKSVVANRIFRNVLDVKALMMEQATPVRVIAVV